LAIANYEIAPSVLSKFLPFGTEPDYWHGKCYVSLVGFMFVNTRLLGIKIPFHVNFEEINLRFYVKRWEEGEWKRGVVFIKEIVPKSAITWVANTLYHENYETLPTTHRWEWSDDGLTVAYSWKKNAAWHTFQVAATSIPTALEADSATEFITEHYWGYAKVHDALTHEYEVKHPRWNVYTVTDYKIQVDFGSVYGPEFEFLNGLTPDSVMLAEGSEIAVGPKKKIFPVNA
jgi:uncharacterized protein YqjF (DUF2071 family)